MASAFALAAGLVFGFGLIIAGMSNPAKVLGFLDITGKWDPSLALVMAGAVAVGVVAFALARRRTMTALGLPLQLPAPRAPDFRLVVGSLLFGIGWGLAGICPGPAIVLLGSGSAKAVAFFVAMLCGMGVYELIDRNLHVAASDATKA